MEDARSRQDGRQHAHEPAPRISRAVVLLDAQAPFRASQPRGGRLKPCAPNCAPCRRSPFLSTPLGICHVADGTSKRWTYEVKQPHGIIRPKEQWTEDEGWEAESRGLDHVHWDDWDWVYDVLDCPSRGHYEGMFYRSRKRSSARPQYQRSAVR
jgi:hypothetical protein